MNNVVEIISKSCYNTPTNNKEQIMIDTSIPYYPLVMHKTDAFNYPKYELPEGYKFVFYKDGDAEKWSEVQTAVGSFSSVEVGTKVFLRDFINGQTLDAKERVLFVTDEKGEYIGTASLWDGNEYGKRLQRIHWVAVKDEHGGKGIAKAMLTRLFDLYNELGFCGFIYLTTGTRNYPAVKLYERFGFELYRGKKSLFKDISDEEFVSRNATAIELLDKMLNR